MKAQIKWARRKNESADKVGAHIKWKRRYLTRERRDSKSAEIVGT